MRRRIELAAIPTQENIVFSSSVVTSDSTANVPPKIQMLITADTSAKLGLMNSIVARIVHNVVAKAILTFIALYRWMFYDNGCC